MRVPGLILMELVDRLSDTGGSKKIHTVEVCVFAMVNYS